MFCNDDITRSLLCRQLLMNKGGVRGGRSHPRRHYEDIAVFSLHVTDMLRGLLGVEHICRQATAYARRRSCHELALTNSVKRLMELRAEAAQMFRSGPQGSMLAFSDPCLLARLPKSAEAVTFSYSSRIETQTSEFANYLVEAVILVRPQCQ